MIRQLCAALFTTLALLAGPPAAAADVNRASVAELEAVKGIGPALSAKITAARQQGPFKDWSDLVDRVAGMGPGSAARLSQNGLTVGGAAFVPAAATDKPAKAQGSGEAAAKKPAREGAAAKPAQS